MNGLPYVGPDGRVVVFPPGQMPPPNFRPAGPMGMPPAGPQGAPPGPQAAPPQGDPSAAPQGPQGAPTPPQGAAAPPQAPGDNLGALGPNNDNSAAWFAAAAAAAQNINNPMAALTSGLSTLTSKLDEREQARRLIKRQEAMDKLQTRRVDIEQQQVDAQGKRWEAEGPEREARAKLATAQAEEVAKRTNQPQYLNLGDGYTRQVNPDGTTVILDAPADMKALANGKLNLERARITAMEGPKWLKGETFYGKDGKSYVSWNNARNGETVFQDTETNERLSAIPGGVMRPQDTGVGKMNDLASKSQEAAYQSAQEHQGRLASYNRAEALIDSAGVGAGWSQQAARGAAEALGMNIGNINLANQQEMEAILSKMELQVAELMKGQGQITESERAILRNAIPQMKQSPEAFRQVLGVYRKASERELAAVDAWDRTPEAERRAGSGYTQFRYRFTRDELKRLNDADAEAKKGQDVPPAGPASQAGGPASAAPDGSFKTKSGTSYKVLGSAAPASPAGPAAEPDMASSWRPSTPAGARPLGYPAAIPDPRRFAPQQAPEPVPQEPPPFGHSALGVPLYGPRAGTSLFR